MHGDPCINARELHHTHHPVALNTTGHMMPGSPEASGFTGTTLHIGFPTYGGEKVGQKVVASPCGEMDQRTALPFPMKSIACRLQGDRLQR